MAAHKIRTGINLHRPQQHQQQRQGHVCKATSSPHANANLTAHQSQTMRSPAPTHHNRTAKQHARAQDSEAQHSTSRGNACLELTGEMIISIADSHGPSGP